MRAMFDTNTYALLYEYDLPRILKLVESGQLVVYGCQVIRNELRDIPKDVVVERKNYRIQLLFVYDKLVKDRSYPVERVVEVLANEYWSEYRGSIPKRKILPDFKIVAVASIHELDVIVSEDERTMKAGAAKRAYEIVNHRNAFRTPKFLSLHELRA